VISFLQLISWLVNIHDYNDRIIRTDDDDTNAAIVSSTRTIIYV